MKPDKIELITKEIRNKYKIEFSYKLNGFNYSDNWIAYIEDVNKDGKNFLYVDVYGEHGIIRMVSLENKAKEIYSEFLKYNS